MDDNDDDKSHINKIRQVLLQTKIEPAKSTTFIDLFRRFFSSNNDHEDLADADCVQGNYHEIIPRLYLGDYRLAMDTAKLKKLGFTHILNAAEGRKFGQINTSATYYEEIGVKYVGFQIIDNPTYTIKTHFSDAIEFLENALKSKRNRVYVHCQQGISRSATLIVAYLLHTFENMSLIDAFQLVATRRRIWPNDGFCRDLILFENERRNNRNVVKQLENCQINDQQNCETDVEKDS